MIYRVGQGTQANRIARNVQENSKGIQCEIAAAVLPQAPASLVMKVDKQVQTIATGGVANPQKNSAQVNKN